MVAHGWAIQPSASRVRTENKAAVTPEIADQQVTLDAEITAASDDAAVEVARFATEVGHEVAPFAAVLLRSESAASSRIEDLTASARAIAEVELSGPGGRNASMVVANQRAMSAAIELSSCIDAAAILAMDATLLGHTEPDIAGRWRDQQVWIGGSDLGPHGAMFVPPSHHRVPAAIDDLITFMGRDDIPTLAHAALAHAQFETIHPFPDGNGRTGPVTPTPSSQPPRLPPSPLPPTGEPSSGNFTASARAGKTG